MPSPSLSAEDELQLSDPAEPAPPPPPPAAPAVDPVELAKMLAKAASARANAAASAGNTKFGRPPQNAPSAPTGSRLSRVPPPARPAAAPSRPVATSDVSDPPLEGTYPTLAPPPPAPSHKPGSRLTAAPPPPSRQKSATEVLEEMARKGEETPRIELPKAKAEAPRPAPAAEPRADLRPDIRAAIEVLVKTNLPNLSGARVMGTLAVEDREAQKALWKGHRARFLATGDVEHGLAASAVISALGRTPPGALAVARLAMAERDWLVWVDTSLATCLASFPNAGLWFNGL